MAQKIFWAFLVWLIQHPLERLLLGCIQELLDKQHPVGRIHARDDRYHVARCGIILQYRSLTCAIHAIRYESAGLSHFVDQTSTGIRDQHKLTCRRSPTSVINGPGVGIQRQE